jgi:NADP-dependent 3-hydroxy acid dehydrogenase YdfG
MAAIALLTGASGGVGQALAAELRREGWTVALVGRNLERLQTAYGTDALCIEADVSTPEGAQSAVETVSAEKSVYRRRWRIAPEPPCYRRCTGPRPICIGPV